MVKVRNPMDRQEWHNFNREIMWIALEYRAINFRYKPACGCSRDRWGDIKRSHSEILDQISIWIITTESKKMNTKFIRYRYYSIDRDYQKQYYKILESRIKEKN